jgi:hypothetical protein
MKKILAGLLSRLLVTGGLSLIFVSGAIAQEAVIRELSGDVEVKAPGGEWAPAAAGQKLERAALISVGFRSSALIAVGNSTITVRSLTRLGLEELSALEGNERVNLNLRVGRVRAEVIPPPGGKTDFTIRSPSVTASVRGTSFEFDGVRLQVEEGRVHVRGKDSGGTYVASGHGVSADAETGRIASVAESAREELALPAPAGVERGQEVRAALFRADPLGTGEIEAGVEWR